MVSFANAASVIVDSGFGIGITDADSVAIASGTGSLRLGYFSSIADGSLGNFTATALLDDFQTYAGAVSSFGGGFNLAGLFNITADTGAKDFSSSFIGQNIYLLAFNADLTQGLIYKFTEVFEADLVDPNPPSSQALSFTLDAPNYLLGTPDSNTGAPLSVNAGRMAVLVPEPSVALLGAFGVLGLLRRRR